MGDGGGGHWLVQMEWRPAGWWMCLPVLIFPCTIKSRSSLLAPSHPGGPWKRAVKRLWCGGVVVSSGWDYWHWWASIEAASPLHQMSKKGCCKWVIYQWFVSVYLFPFDTVGCIGGFMRDASTPPFDWHNMCHGNKGRCTICINGRCQQRTLFFISRPPNIPPPLCQFPESITGCLSDKLDGTPSIKAFS